MNGTKSNCIAIPGNPVIILSITDKPYVGKPSTLIEKANIPAYKTLPKIIVAISEIYELNFLFKTLNNIA